MKALQRLFLMLGLSVSAFTFAAPSATPLNQSVAIVNNQVITSQDLAIETSFMAAQLRGQSQAEVRKAALNNLITQKVLLELAKRNNIHASADLVNNAFSSVARQNNMSAEQFSVALNKQGIAVDNYRNFLKNQLIIRNLEQRVLAGAGLQVSDAEVAQYMQRRQVKQQATTRYSINTILISAKDNSNTALADAKAKAQQVLNEIKAKKITFSKAAKEYSQGANPNKSGSLGWLKLSQLPTMLVSPAQKLKLGELAPLIDTGSGYLIIQLAGKKSDHKQAIKVTENKVRQIVLKTTPIFSDQQAVAKLTQLREQLTKGSISFAKVAQNYSEDPTSSAKGGELGWVLPGQLPPQLEQRIDKLPVNSISEPIRTQTDWRLIEVTARRQVDASKTVAKAQAKQAIFIKKAEAYIANWRQQMRDQAYVETLGQGDS
ncbi:peptidylprolyl isomerase [Piscirickettsia litoralis]|uniref:Chaperone SurA n=1 Tax=Piscirickettsia litoralis TaxID=1891921 RepID=A0ABX3A0Z7_9GAMM|nr:peptidylprolyl isomerase [Piscirickettsia litoralis]ODN42544.1 surA N-terminal domain protein [Piscirickettsia litoralis]